MKPSHRLFCQCLLLVEACLVWATATDTERLINEPGHLKPFGFTDNYMTVEETEGFPFPKEFMQKYVKGYKPVLMKNAAKTSKAFTLWTDEYFLSLDEPVDNSVLVEAKKKEDRTATPSYMRFKDYVRVYNTSGQYLVNSVPHFMRQDVTLPGPLQCKALKDVVVDTVIWFSSGGTNSVVHIDSVDNINCLYRGKKTLIMVDPNKYGDKVDLDRPEGAYSDLDVDKVDFTKYPGIADVQYYKVKMEPGDCLYIPFKWIHQVRSFGSNLAVNVWWDHHKSKEEDLDQCPDTFNPDITLDKVNVKGFEDMNVGAAVVDHLMDHTKNGALDLEGMIKLITSSVGNIKEIDPARGYRIPLEKLFAIMDRNQDDFMTHEEVKETGEKDSKTVGQYIDQFNGHLNDLADKLVQANEGTGDIEHMDIAKDEL